MDIYCCGCQKIVDAVLVNGGVVYPHRPDLHSLPFWQCEKCLNYVGCHHKTSNPTKPLGNIPTAELRNARKHIHAILDPLWKSGRHKRGYVYAKISKTIGYEYHTGEIKTVEDARRIYQIVKTLINSNPAPSGSGEKEKE